jgi:hypothetical protein
MNRMTSHVALLFLLTMTCFLPLRIALAQPDQSPVERLRVADLALLDFDLESACAIWYDSLSESQDVRDVALYRLVRWVEHCPPFADSLPATRLADSLPLPATQVWRAWEFAATVLSRAGEGDRARDYLPQVLKAEDRGWLPVTAPTLWTFAAISWPEQSVTGEGLGTGGLAWTRSCFAVEKPGSAVLRLSFPNPGRALLDGRELAVVGPDTGRSFPATYLAPVHLEAGSHELQILQGVTSAIDDVRVDFVPGAIASRTPCGEGESGGWNLLPLPVANDPEQLAPWLKLAHGEATDADVRTWAAAALTSPDDYLRYRSALYDPSRDVPRREELTRELSSSILVHLDACLPRLDLADSYLSGGEREAARKLLDESDEACLATTRGLLLQAEVALWMQWDALSDRFLQTAHERYPLNCLVEDRWSERQRELGRSLATVVTTCKASVRGLELDAMRRGEEISIPTADNFVEAWREASTTRRKRLLPALAGALDDPQWEGVADELIRSDAHLAWMLADHFLAARKSALANRFATRASEHRNTWQSLRTQAGRTFQWSRVLPALTDLELVIDGYIDDGFAAGSPRVVVLDEAIARPGTNGWLTLAETTVLHVTSPHAAEAIGEVSVAPEEELVELAVRKADGRWFGPSNRGEPGFKDTFSLAGLAPGDFIVRRTIREVALQGGPGSCHVLPPFYFTPREAPVYLSRYVLQDESQDWEVMASSEVRLEQGDGHLIAELRLLEPVAAEPRCPDADAGLQWIQAHQPCVSWDRLRDRVGDALLGYCNGNIELSGAESSTEIYRRTLAAVEEDGSSLFDASQRDILERGRGNRTLALYCALVQAGFDAHIVATHSLAAPSIRWRRPALSPFDVMLVYVAGAESRWFDPYDFLTKPGYIRPALRGRTGLVLTPRYPRLFLTSDDSPQEEGWKIDLDGELEGDGSFHGELILHASGNAAVTVDRQVRSKGAEAKERLAENILYMMLPGVAVTSANYGLEGGTVQVSIEFQGKIDVAGDGRILLRLPPAPAQDLVQLAQRSSALYFGGILPTELTVDLAMDSDLKWTAPGGTQQGGDTFVNLDLAVEASKRSLHVYKRVQSPPRRVEPAQYGEFVQSQIRLHRLKLLPIEVRHEDDR